MPKGHISKACNSCRVKKIRCDGGKPCSKCLISNKDCIYVSQIDGRKIKAKSEYLRYLQEKNTTLMNALIEISQKHHDVKEMCEEILVESRTSHDFINQAVMDDFISALSLNRDKEEYNFFEGCSQGFKVSNTIRDDLVSMEWNLQIDEDGNTKFFGPSSNQVRNIKDQEKISFNKHSEIDIMDNMDYSELSKKLSEIDKQLLKTVFEHFSETLPLTLPSIKDFNLDSSDLDNYPLYLESPNRRFLYSCFFAFISTIDKTGTFGRKYLKLFMKDAEIHALELLKQYSSSPNILEYYGMLQGFMLLQSAELVLSNDSMSWSYSYIVASQLIRIGLHITTEMPLNINEGSGEVVISTKKYFERIRSRLLWSFILLDRIFTSIYGRCCGIPYSRLIANIYEPQSNHISEQYFKHLTKLWVFHDKFMDQIYSFKFKEKGILHKIQLFCDALDSYRIFYESIPKVLEIKDFRQLETSPIESLLLNASFYTCLLLVVRPYHIIKDVEYSIFETSFIISERATKLIIRIHELSKSSKLTLPFYLPYFLFTISTFYLFTLGCFNELTNIDITNLSKQRLSILLSLIIDVGSREVSERYILLLKERSVDWKLSEDVISTIDFYYSEIS